MLREKIGKKRKNMDKKLEILKGVRVIDLSIYVAAPATASMLGYFGADVIKVEPPKGDPYRKTGLAYGLPASSDVNPIFDACNANKRSISINFRTDEGKAVMKRLIKSADIFVTNYRRPALEGMQVSYEDAVKINPGIVYGIIDGYGEKGTCADKSGFDSTAFYARGGFSMAARYEESPPMPTISATGDCITSLSLTAGVLAAHNNKLRTGHGDLVTSSLFSSCLWALSIPLALYQFGYSNKLTLKNPGILPIIHDYQCSDGIWIRICCMSPERYWAPLCKAMEIEEYIEDERFATSGPMHDNIELGVDILQSQFEKNTYDYWAERLNENDIAFEKCQDLDDILKDEQAFCNNFLSKQQYPEGMSAYMSMPPFKFRNAGDLDKTRGPKLGEHTWDVLKEYDFTDEQIKDLLKSEHIQQYHED